MSKEHRRSLVVFALVAVACAVIVATGLRSDAVRGFLGRQAGDVVAGSVLTPAHPDPTTVRAEHTGDVADVTSTPDARAHEVQRAPALQVAHTGHAYGHLKTRTHGRGHAWGHLKTGHLETAARAGKLGPGNSHARWARGQFPGHGRALGHY